MTALSAPRLDQKHRALKLANTKRRAAAELKKLLHNNDRMFAAHVVETAPAALAHMRTLDVLLCATTGKLRGKLRPQEVERLNLAAAREGVNLAVPLGRLSERQRLWLAEAVRG